MRKEIKTRQQLIEGLNEIDRKCIDEGIYFYDFKTLFEALSDKLSAQDKVALKKAVDIGDKETIEAVFKAKMAEDLEEGFDNDVIEYKGYYIEHGFYGGDEYTVQYDGDDIEFNSVEDAKQFIDEVSELEEDFDDDYEPNLSDKEIIRRIFGSFGVKLFSIVNKFDGSFLVNVDADGYREVEDTLDREIFNHGFDIVDSNVGEPNRYTERETLDITLMKDNDYNNEEGEDDLELVTDDMNAGYWYESLIEDINRYSDVIPKEKRKFWYFTTHGVQPGSIPNDLNVLEIKDTPNGTFVALDGVLNTSELRKYDMKEKSPNDALEESVLTNDEYDYFNVYDENGLVGEFPTYEDAKNACGEGCTINGVVQYGGDEYEETPLNEDAMLEAGLGIVPFEYYIYFDGEAISEDSFKYEREKVFKDAEDDLFTFLNSDLVKDTVKEELDITIEDIEFVDNMLETSYETIHGLLNVHILDDAKISSESLFEVLNRLVYKWEYRTEITIQGPKRDVDDWDEWELELYATAELDYSE